MEDPGTDAPSRESTAQGQVPDKYWERCNLSTRPPLERGGTMLDYFNPALTMGHTNSTQPGCVDDEEGFGMDDGDDEWLAATPGIEMSSKEDAEDTQEESRTVKEDCQSINDSPDTAPSSENVDKLCKGKTVEKYEEDICGEGRASGGDHSECATTMNVRNDGEGWSVQSNQQMNVQPGSSDDRQIREGGNRDKCVFNDNMSKCETHDCAVRNVKVTSVKWRWKPKQKIYGNVSTKEKKYICIGRGLVKKGPDTLCTATQPGPNFSGGADYLRHVDGDLRSTRLKSESLLADKTGIDNELLHNPIIL